MDHNCTHLQIIEEQLAFPSGTATAQLISVLHRLPPPDTSVRHRRGYRQIGTEEYSDSPDIPTPSDTDHIFEDVAPERAFAQQAAWQALTWSFVASSFLTVRKNLYITFHFELKWLRSADRLLFSCRLLHIAVRKLSGARMAVDFHSQSLLRGTRSVKIMWCTTYNTLISITGIIMGFPTTLNMNLVGLTNVRVQPSNLIHTQGMLVGWGILSPLSKLSGWAPGPAGDMTTGARGWILWTSLAIMCADSFVSLLPAISEYLMGVVRNRATRNIFGDHADTKEDHEIETEDRLVPSNWVVVGLVVSVVAGTVLVRVVFGNESIKPWATILGFAIGGILSILG